MTYEANSLNIPFSRDSHALTSFSHKPLYTATRKDHNQQKRTENTRYSAKGYVIP